jgi:hypothetical protein
MEVRPYRPEDRAVALAFARRIAPQKSFVIPERIHDDYLSEPRLLEQHVAVDEGGVHGGFGLRYDPYYIDGEKVTLGYYSYPISEGIVNRRYACVGLQILQAAQQNHDYLYGIGSGGLSAPIMQVLLRSGFSGCNIPFFFQLLRPARCFQMLPSLQSNLLRRTLARCAAWSGLGWTGVKSVQLMCSARNRRALRSVRYASTDKFGHWTDELFARHRREYRFIASRESDVLGKLYPEASNVHRGVVYSEGERVGWFVAIAPMLNKEKYFGELKVGLVADFFAAPCHANAVVSAATAFLKRQQVDLLVSNASHAAWKAALRNNGYLSGPSNYPLTISPKLVERIAPFPASLDSAHLTRTDGDGLSAFLTPSESVRYRVAA